MTGADTGPVVGVVFAAGAGERFGGPKQFADLNGVRLVDRVVASAATVCDRLIVVLPLGHDWTGAEVAATAYGGDTHRESVARGMAAIPEVCPEAEIVVLASPSHPLATPALYRRVVDAVRAGADAAAPMAALPDALKERDGSTVVASVDKTNLVSIQAPGAVRRRVLEAALASGESAPEEMELVQRWGGRVVLVDGERTNLHVTTPMELTIACRLEPLTRPD